MTNWSKLDQVKGLFALGTCHFGTGGALGMFSSVIGETDGVADLISFLGIFDPQREDVVSLRYHVLAALKNGLFIFQPLGFCSLCVCLTVEDNLTSFFHFCVFNWCDNPQFFCNKIQN